MGFGDFLFFVLILCGVVFWGGCDIFCGIF